MDTKCLLGVLALVVLAAMGILLRVALGRQRDGRASAAVSLMVIGAGIGSVVFLASLAAGGDVAYSLVLALPAAVLAYVGGRLVQSVTTR